MQLRHRSSLTAVRLAVALAVALATGSAATAAEPPKPAIVVQVKPVSRLLTDYKEMLRQIGGPTEGDRLVKGFETSIKDKLGDNGFEGLDINRPIAAYSVLKEKAEDCSLTLVVPVLGEKEFIGFLERIHVKAEAVKDKKGLYTLDVEGGGFLIPNHSHLRFSDNGWAYIGVNEKEPTEPKEFVAIGDLLDNADQSLFSVKLFPGRVPPKLIAGFLDEMDNSANGVKGFIGAAIEKKHLAKLATTFLTEGPKLVRRYGETGLKEATEVGVRFSFDIASGDTVTDLTVTPKAGSAFAKELAAKPATNNRFANFIPKDAVFGVTLKAPLFAPEIREIGGALVEAGAEELKNLEGVPEKLRPVVDEGAKALLRSVKAGNLDGAIALVGPDKGGKFTLLAGVSLDDTATIEKSLRDAAKDSALTKEFEFDAAKVGTVGVHKVPLGRLIPEGAAGELAKVFGDKSPAYLAFAKDAIIVGYGPGALDAVKTALEAKPGAAPVIDLTLNANRLQKLVAAIDEKSGATIAKLLGTDDKPVSAFRVTVEGGATLKVKATVNLRYAPKLLEGVLGSKAEAEFKPANPGK